MKNFIFSFLALFAVSTGFCADKSVTAANVLASTSASISSGFAGEAVTAGQPVFKDVATGKWLLSDANVTAKAKVDGVTLHAAALNQPLQVVTKDPDFTPGITIASGETIVLSATAGAVCPDADITSTGKKIIMMVGTGSNKASLAFLAGGVIP